ncbi:hypothetical protein ACOME3_006891 [Neoechinorhynchus agilis]
MSETEKMSKEGKGMRNKLIYQHQEDDFDDSDYKSLISPGTTAGGVTWRSASSAEDNSSQVKLTTRFSASHASSRSTLLDPHQYIRSAGVSTLKDKAQEQLDICILNKKRAEAKRNELTEVMAERSKPSEFEWNDVST